jgi:hypothetical protein
VRANEVQCNSIVWSRSSRLIFSISAAGIMPKTYRCKRSSASLSFTMAGGQCGPSKRLAPRYDASAANLVPFLRNHSTGQGRRTATTPAATANLPSTTRCRSSAIWRGATASSPSELVRSRRSTV